MATVLSGGQVRFNLSGTETTAVGAAFRTMQMQSPAGVYSTSIANGTTSAQGNTLASITGTTNSTGISIDLQNLVLAGIDDPLTLVQIKAILIQETSSPIGSNLLLIGDSSGTLTNAFTAFWTLPTGQGRVGSGGAVSYSNPLGYTVDASHKILKILTNSGTATYQIDIIGVK